MVHLKQMGKKCTGQSVLVFLTLYSLIKTVEFSAMACIHLFDDNNKKKIKKMQRKWRHFVLLI